VVRIKWASKGSSPAVADGRMSSGKEIGWKMSIALGGGRRQNTRTDLPYGQPRKAKKANVMAGKIGQFQWIAQVFGMKYRKDVKKLGVGGGEGKMVVPAPVSKLDELGAIPKGNLVTIKELRSALARKHAAKRLALPTPLAF